MSIEHSNIVGADDAPVVLAKRTHTPEERRAPIARIVKLSEGLSLGDLKIRDLVAEGRR